MEKHYNSEAAEAAQADYTDRNHCPMFAPKGGICYRCSRNIYGTFKTYRGVAYGYSVEYAENHLITRCPFCSASFTE